MSKNKNSITPQPLTAEKLWPVVLALGKKQMEALFNSLMEYLYPWPEDKLEQIHKEIQAGKVLSEDEFQARFSAYINPKD